MASARMSGTMSEARVRIASVATPGTMASRAAFRTSLPCYAFSTAIENKLATRTRRCTRILDSIIEQFNQLGNDNIISLRNVLEERQDTNG
jgi:hypothetical protein